MTPEEKELLEETARLVKENHKILKGIRRSARILGSAFGTYYFLQPYVNVIVKSYNGMQQNLQSVKDATAKLPALPTWMGGK